MIDHIIGLIESRLELAKLEAKEEAAFVLARIVLAMALGLFLFFTWFFLALGLGLLMNVWMESSYLGVLSVGILHLVLFILIYLLRGKMGLEKGIKKLIDSIFQK